MTISIVKADCLDFLRGLPADSVDLVFGSPPYCDARTYGIGAERDCLEWVEWMLEVTLAAVPVSRGPVFWVVAGVTRERSYWPACEGLMWEWWKKGGSHQMYRPCAWVKTDNDDGGTGIPGSGGDDYLRADWEYVICFKRPGILAWSDNTACGHPPVVEEVGGEMSNRTADGQRINAGVGRSGKSRSSKWGGNGKRANGNTKQGSATKEMYTRNADGSRDTERGESYVMPKLANPGNVVKARVGGGHMGNKICHKGEAPFPEALAEFFVLSFCPPDGTVCDPFSGSGTTAAVSVRHGRNFTGCDLRQSQVDLGLKRVASETPLGLFA